MCAPCLLLLFSWCVFFLVKVLHMMNMNIWMKIVFGFSFSPFYSSARIFLMFFSTMFCDWCGKTRFYGRINQWRWSIYLSVSGLPYCGTLTRIWLIVLRWLIAIIIEHLSRQIYLIFRRPCQSKQSINPIEQSCWGWLTLETVVQRIIHRKTNKKYLINTNECQKRHTRTTHIDDSTTN